MVMSASPASGFHVNITLPKINIRNEKGWYTSAIAELYTNSREQAELQQGEVGARVRNNIQRKSVTTGRLVRVTLDPKNVVATRTLEDQFTVGVGNVAWLDRSIAKYWRTIEEGSAATWTKRSFTSLPLQGFWGHSLGNYQSGPSGPWVSVNSPYDRNRGAMFQPFRVGRNGHPSGLPAPTPGHEIRPMNAYRSVAESPNFRRANLLIVGRFFAKVLPPGFIHNPGQFFAGY